MKKRKKYFSKTNYNIIHHFGNV
uniref:Uncharacterized protein n=1 Tax=Anopheles dirus TaxID=7168 RepID=A0A182NXZ7_9DIPT